MGVSTAIGQVDDCQGNGGNWNAKAIFGSSQQCSRSCDEARIGVAEATWKC